MAATKEYTEAGWKIEEVVDLTVGGVDVEVDTAQLNKPFRISYVVVHYSATVTETVKLSLKPEGNATQETVLVTASLSTEQDVYVTEDEGATFEPGDVLRVYDTDSVGSGTAFVKMLLVPYPEGE